MSNTIPKNDEAQAVITHLAELFPKAIFVYEARRKPLAIGIRHQISERVGDAIAPDELGAALRSYTRNVGYLKAMARPGAQRIDIEGNPVDAVTPEQAASAAKGAAAHWARQAARKATARMACAEPEPPVSIPETPSGPKRLGLADLRQLAQVRKATV
jgi:sRNA-binding protein